MPTLAQEIEAQIEALEAESGAEVVVSLQESSGNYADLDLGWGIVFGLFILGYNIWSTYAFHPDWVVANVGLSGLLGYAMSRWLGLRRPLLSPRRLEGAVERAARAQFYALGIHQTRDRTGILVYVSRYERRIELVPDAGLRAQLSPQLWNGWKVAFGEASSERDLLEKLKAQLEAMEGPLRRQCPRREDDINELPNQMVEGQ